VTRLADLSASHIRGFLVHEQERGVDDDTVITSFRVIRAWLNFCVNEELIPASPMRKVKAPTLPKEILPAFAPEDVRKLLGACRTLRDTAMVLFLLDTGVRASELVALNVGDLDPVSGAVQVKQGKGRKDRLVFLGAKAHKALKKYLQERVESRPTEPLWLSENTGERLTIWGLERFCDRVGRRADVEHCHPHTFRRTFALWSLRAEMNIYALQQIMGHSDLSMLRRYLALVQEDLHEAHRKHGAVVDML
jgi:site-specific recombinase XerD